MSKDKHFDFELSINQWQKEELIILRIKQTNI